MIGCDCAVCRSSDPRNHRYRCSVLIRTPHGNLLIDTPPELRLQLLRERVRVVHAVLFTHYHADHLFGLDDLRPSAPLGGPVPLYCTAEVEGKIRQPSPTPSGPQAESLPVGFVPSSPSAHRRRSRSAFSASGSRRSRSSTPISTSSAFGSATSLIAPTSARSRGRAGRAWRDCACWCSTPCATPHIAHFSLEQALDVIEKVRPRKWPT